VTCPTDIIQGAKGFQNEAPLCRAPGCEATKHKATRPREREAVCGLQGPRFKLVWTTAISAGLSLSFYVARLAHRTMDPTPGRRWMDIRHSRARSWRSALRYRVARTP
jgi:hypothetical protein